LAINRGKGMRPTKKAKLLKQLNKTHKCAEKTFNELMEVGAQMITVDVSQMKYQTEITVLARRLMNEIEVITNRVEHIPGM